MGYRTPDWCRFSFVFTPYMGAVAVTREASMETIEQKRNIERDPAGLWIPAGALLGLGIGMLYGQTAAGVLIGLGAGFMLMFVTKMVLKH